MVHEPGPDGDEDLILMVVAQGPIEGIDENGDPAGIIDNELMRQFARQGGIGHLLHGDT